MEGGTYLDFKDMLLKIIKLLEKNNKLLEDNKTCLKYIIHNKIDHTVFVDNEFEFKVMKMYD